MAWAKSRDRGASAVEYALIVGLIAAVVGGVIWVLGTRVNWMFEQACNNVTTGNAADRCGDPAR
ncbi:Flp family type IVb pilin [Micromonospora sp. IBHARD004]|uniref:Flp family type IVb pilin n=1 Tax=Micromonospora sp. IBHARD004 TaxID=3457764 RepID=UPI004057D90E